jgi:hypothetical protein
MSKKFELGLVMAGAISAGAYTAGVLDFLIEALEAWEKEKERNRAAHGDNYAAWDTPWHDVVVKALTGASAGGMCAAITASAMGGDIVPIRTEEDAEAKASQNKLFKPWVKDINMLRLLESKDLEREGRILSLLDSTIIDEIATDCIGNFPVQRKRKYFADNLQLYLTTANLRGVPYSIGFKGESGYGHRLSHHADYYSFDISQNGNHKYLKHIHIPFNSAHPDFAKGRDVLRNAAMTTGAFPIGLAARKVSRIANEYGARGIINHPNAPQPEWPGHINPTTYKYDCWSIDGGTFDNEPLEMTRQALLENGETHNPSNPEDVKRAVIMVDPFPSPPFETIYEETNDLFGLLPQIIGALRQQAKFKLEELQLAVDETVYSRFMIAPVRHKEDGTHEPWPIACAVLGGFGGFLSEKFRGHDFFLGRRNAQRFFDKHFAIPYEAAKQNPVLKDVANDPRFDKLMKFTDDEGKEYYCILPLVSKELTDPLYKPEWPVGQVDLTPVEKGIKHRAVKMIETLTSSLNKAEKAGVNIIKGPIAKRVADAVIRIMIKDLQKLKLVP